MTSLYHYPAAPVKYSHLIKKSQFIAFAAEAVTREQAMGQLAALKSDYPDARHHCWAYVLGDPKQPSSVAFNDDGEPSGTAGKPILNVLQHREIGDIMVVIVRYFGGIKLGAGGLVRAYSTATQEAVELLTTTPRIPKTIVRVLCNYDNEPGLRRYLEQCDGIITSTDYSEKLSVTIEIPIASQESLADYCGERNGMSLRSTDEEE